LIEHYIVVCFNNFVKLYSKKSLFVDITQNGSIASLWIGIIPNDIIGD